MYLPSLVRAVPNNCVTVNMINPDQYLISSILLETLSTTLLKKTIENKLWFIPTYIGYLFIVDSIHFMFSGLFSFQHCWFVFLFFFSFSCDVNRYLKQKILRPDEQFM